MPEQRFATRRLRLQDADRAAVVRSAMKRAVYLHPMGRKPDLRVSAALTTPSRVKVDSIVAYYFWTPSKLR
jgi:hypothetical protein